MTPRGRKHACRGPRTLGARPIEPEGIDLRLTGRAGPTIYLAGTPVTGAEARRLNGLGTGETIAIVAGVVVAALVVGVLVLQDAVCCESFSAGAGRSHRGRGPPRPE